MGIKNVNVYNNGFFRNFAAYSEYCRILHFKSSFYHSNRHFYNLNSLYDRKPPPLSRWMPIAYFVGGGESKPELELTHLNMLTIYRSTPFQRFFCFVQLFLKPLKFYFSIKFEQFFHFNLCFINM